MSGVLLGKVIAFVAPRDRLTSVCLPSHVDQDLLDAVLQSANSRPGGQPPGDEDCFAIRVVPDDHPAVGLPLVPKSRAGEYRIGSRLYIWKLGDYEPDKTISSVVSPLVAPGFPNNPDSKLPISAIASGFRQLLAAEICDHLTPANWDLLQQSVEGICAFITDALKEMGTASVARSLGWWKVVGTFLDCLADLLRRSQPGTVNPVRDVHAAAGLPVPRSGCEYSLLDATKYAQIVDERFCSASDAEDTLAWLKATQAGGGPVALALLPWDSSYAGLIQVSKNPMVALTGLGAGTQERMRAWANTSEELFAKLLALRAGAGRIEANVLGKPCPVAMGTDDVFILPTRKAAWTFPDKDKVEVRFEDTEFLVPWYEGVSQSPGMVHELPSMQVKPKTAFVFTVTSARKTPEGLLVKGILVFSAKSKKEWPRRVTTVTCDGCSELPGCVNTSAKAHIVVPCPWIPTLVVAYGQGKPKIHVQGGGKFKITRKTFEPLADIEGVLSLKQEVGAVITCYDGVQARPQPTPDARIVTERHASVPVPGDWDGLETIERIRLVDGLQVATKEDGTTLLTVAVEEEEERPWLPLAATAAGTACQFGNPLPEMLDTLQGHLEQMWTRDLAQQAGTAPERILYCILPTTTPDTLRGNKCQGAPYTHWLMRPEEPATLEIENAGKGPSPALYEHPMFGKMLGSLDAIIDSLQRSGNGGAGTWPSRWQLKDVPFSLINDYLEAFTRLVEHARTIGTSELFWASYPFSAIVYDCAHGEVKAVLLSSLHPVRLAWLYGIERALVEDGLHGTVDSAIAQVLEGWNFPYLGPVPSLGGSQDQIVATPVDSGPEQIFIGWSILVSPKSEGNKLLIPPYAAGWRMPGGSGSGLNEGGVGSALRDYMRVYPHLTTLILELFSHSAASRSGELDNAIISELTEVAKDGVDAIPLPYAVRVLDSSNRIGAPPDRDMALSVFDRSSGEPLPVFEWCTYPAKDAQKVRPDVRFVEDAQARIAPTMRGERIAAVPRWPTRRFSGRQVSGNDLLLHPILGPRSQGWAEYAAALTAMETLPDATPALLVRPVGQLLGVSSQAKWVITGNVHLDPAAVSSMVSGNGSRPGGSEKMLWEWRPPFLPRRRSKNGGLNFSRRPYMTIAKVPESFKERIAQLRGLGQEQALALLDLLGHRGIGLASLLAMGDNHSEGALGFFYALKLLDIVVEGLAAEGYTCVVPLDAVNSLLGTLTGEDMSDNHRADLLLVHIPKQRMGDVPELVLLPVEIRCTGFTPTGRDAGFPQAHAAEVLAKVEQVNNTTRSLLAVIGRITKPGTSNLLATTAVANIIETAFLVAGVPPEPVVAADALQAVLDGRAMYRTGAGVLLWFQATPPSAAKLQWVPPTPEQPNGILFVDPVAHKNEIWEGTRAGLATQSAAAIRDCLARGTLPPLSGPAPDGGPEPSSGGSPTSQAMTSPGPLSDTGSSHGSMARANAGGSTGEPAGQPGSTPSGAASVSSVQQQVPRPRVLLGSSDRFGDVYWDPFHVATPLVNAHTVILGSAGSGKTQALTAFIYELHKQGIPSLVLDFKDDYIKPDVLGMIGGKMHDAVRGLPVNPLALMPDPATQEVSVVTQVYEMCGIFKAVYTLGDQQEANLRRALFDTYEAAGIPRDVRTLPPDISFPSFDAVKVHLQNTGDTALENRLSPIFDLSLFPAGAGALDQLLVSTTVVRVTRLPNEQVKKAAGGFILRGFYNALLRQGHYRGIRMALVIDEAHRVANLDPVKLLVKEGRAYGIAAFLSTQEARDLDDFVYSNAGSLLSLKLGETTDAERIAKILGGSQGYRRLADELAALPRFHGMFRNDHYSPYANVEVLPFYKRAEGRAS